MAKTVDIVRSFRALRVLVLGDAMLDTYLEGTAARLCTEGPVPVLQRTSEAHAPGGAANTAANLQALGAKVNFVTVVGRDSTADILRTALGEAGVDDAFIVTDDTIHTLHKLRVLADDQYVARVDTGEAHTLSPANEAALIRALEAAWNECDVIVIADYRYGAVSDGVLQRVRTLRRERPIALIVDSKDLKRFRGMQATVVTPNHFEAILAVETEWQLGGPVNIDDMAQVGMHLRDEIDAEYVALTMAEQGVLVVGAGAGFDHIPAHPVAHANDVGAGDSFTAALALALAAGATAVEAATVGVEAAGIAITRRRTAVVGYQELLQRVSLRDGALSPDVQTLAHDLATQRAHGKTVVFTNGVFDILHAGHVHLLRQARALGDVLVVGVNTDRSARQLKGKNRPINSERDRLALVAALDAVDYAVLFDESVPSTMIRRLRPHIHVKGGDYAGAVLPEAEAVAEVGGRVEIVQLQGDVSTSSVIDRILALALETEGRPQ